MRKQISKVMDLCTNYAEIPAVIGFEKPFLDYLTNCYTQLNCTVIRNKHCIYVAGNNPSQAVVTAHADRHGLVAKKSSIHEAFAVYAATDRKHKLGIDEKLDEKEFSIIQKRFLNQSMIAYNAQTGSIYPYDIHIDSGNVDNQFIIRGIEQNSRSELPLMYNNTFSHEGNRVSGQLDNYLSLAYIEYLYRNGYQGSAIIAGDEEIGMSAQHINSMLDSLEGSMQRPIYTLDTSSFNSPAYVSHGPIILRYEDDLAKFDAELSDELLELTTLLDLPVIIKDIFDKTNDQALGIRQKGQTGKTELGHIISNSDGRYKGTTIQTPTTGFHTNNESTTIQAIEHQLALLTSLFIPITI